ncbi:MAG: S1 RNA-binding domain-containing protein, partial [Chloroflexi bacterium]|nr:S1 RNA-binding domain-containing protein [Chloroflexota bacterium]
TVCEATVLESNRGGLTVEFGRLRGFVPMSQLIGFGRIRQASERYRRLNALVGKKMLLKVIEVNRGRRRLILSQQAAVKEWRAERRRQLLEELQPGQVRTGRVSQITNFGLFINLGGLDGLVHVSELSWGRIENPAEVYHVGQRIKVKVLSVDRERQRIALSIKALTPDPWETAEQRYTIGKLVEGKVSQMADFGIFVELEPGVEGLLHNSELLSDEQREELAVGTNVLVKVIRIEPDRRRIGLSARKVGREEWEQWYAEAATRAAAQEQARREAEAQAAPESESAESPLAEDEVFDEETLGSDILLGDETSEDFVGDVAETPAA